MSSCTTRSTRGTRRGRRGRSGRSGRRGRRGGNAVGRAIVPFGLLALSNYLGNTKRRGRRGRRSSTKKGMLRLGSRRAYMKLK